MVGVPVLAKRLMQIQATIVAKCMPDIVNKINQKLNVNVAQLQTMPKNLSSIAEAMTAFMQIMGLAKDSLRKILLRGEFDEYSEDKEMHCTAHLVEMLDKYFDKLQKCRESDFAKDFLLEELEIERIQSMPVEFESSAWDYIASVVLRVMIHHWEVYPQLQNATRRAVQTLMAKVKERAIGRVVEIIQMEKYADFTCNPEYMVEWTRLMEMHAEFIKSIDNPMERSELVLEGTGLVNLVKLRERRHLARQAFDLRMRMVAYWRTALRRLVDTVALHLLFTVQGLVNEGMVEVMSQVVGPLGGGLQMMMEETPAVAAKREKLKKSISLLKESKEVVAQIMDKVSKADMEK
ncbi:hypothetical protein MLD38_017785 [Melastoma candidum]|uniref:Uncharacterized protein n=1 Tax=Melastoma candidum TaxID=119954 RepID=A0ACB9QUV9_9MYRT|nr:hypothetical protein MLD38_017785 [Melastoma candidum]